MKKGAAREYIAVGDVLPEIYDFITIAGITVRIVAQRTGFGHRRYFLCPSCGRRCGKLYFMDGVHCPRCVPFDLYWYRQSLYDEGGTALIVWHMNKLAATISDQPIRYPFCNYDYSSIPPQGMRKKRYREILLKLQILENMRFTVIFHGCRYNGADIKRYTSDGFIAPFELWQVTDYQIFGTEIPPEYYSFLLDEETAPEMPLYRSSPFRVSPAASLRK